MTEADDRGTRGAEKKEVDNKKGLSEKKEARERALERQDSWQLKRWSSE